MAKNFKIPKDNNIIKISMEEAMPDNYLPYAVEVAKERALPDVRDGLKPVHRRILYGAYMLKAFPDKPYYKSARIVGDILGKYHPHGDTSVYDAMVILAQDFTTRKPLIDGHGNWGSIDGDSAAAMRYTEARLTPISLEMIKDIDKGVVDMVDNYSGSEKEPQVLPAKYPNLLVNGAFGIAVGLATNIPPHNLGEVIDATLAYMENKDITTEGLMEYVKGPDLPTGGLIIGKESLKAAYATGMGKVTLRAKTRIEKLENGRLGIIITEFPYRKNKAKLLQTISEMTGDKKHMKVLEAVADIRDESDRRGIRAVIEFKKSADMEIAEKIRKYLFKKTELQSNISFNMVALADGKPETMGLKTILYHYINHQKDVVTRRTTRELEIAKKRFHIVEGFIKAIDIIDAIITTIRGSKSKKDAQENLKNKYGFTEIQAQAIVELMLYRLTGLEISTFEKEYKNLEKLIKKLTKILNNEKELMKVIKMELLEVKEKYNDERRTKIIEDDSKAKIDVEEFIFAEDIVITMSNDGYIKRISEKAYKRSNTDVENIEYREGDFNKFLLKANTMDTLMFFTDKGNMYQLKGNFIPEHKWKEKGEKIDTLIRSLKLSKEKIIKVYPISNILDQKEFMFITENGFIKKTELNKFDTNYSKLQALKIKKEDNLAEVFLTNRERERKFIKVTTKKGLQFSLEEPLMESQDRNGRGEQFVNLPTKDSIVNAKLEDNYEYKEFGVSINSAGKLNLIKKSGIGNSNKKCNTNSASELFIFADNGNVLKIPSYMVQNIDKTISIRELYTGFLEKENKIVAIVSVQGFNYNKEVYFYSKKGFVKKTMISEFNQNEGYVSGYKFKEENDILINVDFKENDTEDTVIVTEKGMAIRFSLENITAMSKNASGVKGISLKEDDNVVYAAIIKDEEQILKLTSKSKKEKEVSLNEIKKQNRAGTGKNIFVVELEDMIHKVIVK